MTDVARLQIAVDSRQVLEATTNLAAMGTAASRAARVTKNLGDKKVFSGINGSAEAAAKEFKALEGVIDAFSGKIDKAGEGFGEFAADANKINGTSSNTAKEVGKIATAMESISGVGGANAITNVSEAINSVGANARANTTPIKLLAKMFRSLRDSASGISTSGDSFKTSISGLARPAGTAATSLQRTADAAAALSSSMKRLGKQKFSNIISQAAEASKTASGEFSSLIEPIGAVAKELAQFSTNLNGTARAMTDLKNDIGGVASQFDVIFQSVQKMSQKEGLDAFKLLGTTVENFGQSLRRTVPGLKAVTKLMKALKDNTKGINGILTGMNTRFDKMGTEASTAATGLQKVTNEVAESAPLLQEMGANAREASAGLRRLSKTGDRLKATASQITSVGTASRGAFNFVKQFATGLGLVSGGFAAALGARGFVNALKDFELQAAKTNAVAVRMSGSFAEIAAQQASLEKQSRSLGATTRFTAVEASEAQFFLARAGFEVNEVLDATEATLNLAAAGYLELGEAADIASNILQQFGLETTQLAAVTDSLVATANNANTSVEQMAQALSYAGPFAASLGVSVDEASAAIGALGNAGIQGSLAGTNLRGILISLVSPSRTAGETLDKLAARLGKGREAFDVTTQGLEDVIKNLKKATDGTEDAAEVFAEIFNRRNVSGALALTKNVQELEDLLKVIVTSAGEAQRVADQVDDTLAGAFLRAKSAVVEFALASGEGGLGQSIREVVDGFTNAVRFLGGTTQAFLELNESGRIAIKVMKGVAVAIATVGGLMVGGILSRGLSSALGGFKALRAQKLRAIDAFSRLTKGVTLAGTAVTRFSGATKLAMVGLRAVPFLGAALAAYELGSALLSLISPIEREAEATEVLNEATREKIALEEELLQVKQRAKSVGGDVATVDNLRASESADLSTIVGASDRAQKAIEGLITQLQGTSAGGGVFASEIRALIPDLGTIATAADRTKEKLTQLNKDNNLGLSTDDIDALRRAYIDLEDQVEVLGFKFANAQRELFSEQDVNESATRIQRLFSEAFTGARGTASRFDFIGPEGIAGLRDAVAGAVQEGANEGFITQAAADSIKEDIDRSASTLINQGTVQFEAARAAFASAATDRLRAGEFVVFGRDDVEILLQILAARKEVEDTEREILKVTTDIQNERAKEADRAAALAVTRKDVLAELKDEETLFRRTQGLEGARLAAARQRLEVEKKFAEVQDVDVKDVRLPADVNKALNDAERRAIIQEQNDALDRQLEKVDRLVDRANNRAASAQLNSDALRVQAGLMEEVSIETQAALAAERELLKLRETDAIPAGDLADRRRQLEEAAAASIRAELDNKGLKVLIAQNKTVQDTLEKLNETSGVNSQLTAAAEAQLRLKLAGARLDAEGFAQLVDRIKAERDLNAQLQRRNRDSVLDDLRAENKLIEDRNAAVRAGREFDDSQAEAAEIVAGTPGFEKDAQFLNKVVLLLQKRNSQLRIQKQLQEDIERTGRTEETIKSLQRENESRRIQLGLLEQLSARQEALRVIEDQDLVRSEDTVAAIEKQIKVRRILDELEGKNNVTRQSTDQVTQAINQSQQSLADGLLQVAKGAQSAEEAMQGFILQLIEAIAKAKIFQALGQTGLFDQDGLIGAAVSAGTIRDGSRGLGNQGPTQEQLSAASSQINAIVGSEDAVSSAITGGVGEAGLAAAGSTLSAAGGTLTAAGGSLTTAAGGLTTASTGALSSLATAGGTLNTAAASLSSAAAALTASAGSGNASGLAALAGAASYKGNVFSGGVVANEFYSGGIPGIKDLPKVGSIPQTFRGSDGSINTLREGGSSEAILPLGRDGQGRLGVRMMGGSDGGTINNTTNNTTVQNFNLSSPEDTFGLTDRQRERRIARFNRK